MEDVRLLSDLQLRRPVLLFGFTGWNDAGEGASGSIRVLAEHWDATQVAELDPEPFTDFATVRPFVVIDEGHRQIVWPTVDVWAASLPSTDVLLVIGPEPAMQWRRFCDQIVSVAKHYDVSMAIGLGALLAEYPHRRPAHLTATSTDESLRERFGLRTPSYEGPDGNRRRAGRRLGRGRRADGVVVGRRADLHRPAGGGQGDGRAGPRRVHDGPRRRSRRPPSRRRSPTTSRGSPTCWRTTSWRPTYAASRRRCRRDDDDGRR